MSEQRLKGAQRRPIMNRPRYVAGLVAGAVVVAAREIVQAFTVPMSDYSHSWLFVDLESPSAYGLLALRVALYGLGAWGLWQGKAWARWGTMVYLAAELTAFVMLGAGDWGQFFGLHILLVPYATFGFMYLQRGAKDFE